MSAEASVEGKKVMKTIVITRFDPDKDEGRRTQEYTIPVEDDWKILDAINYIKDEVDPTVSHRWSCRMAVCGSCGMMVNGEPTLTCKTALTNYGERIVVEPLANFPVVRDLVVDLDGFMDKVKSVKPWIMKAKEEAASEEFNSKGTYSQSPEQLATFKQFSMCINCMLCYSACPVVGLEPDFIGPAAIALAQRYNLDSRDQGAGGRMEVLDEHEGMWGCTFVGECTEVCPKNVDPAGAIQLYKAASATNWFKSILLPRGSK
jgi:fumarate reductase iron-sulfur subunit